MPREMSLIQHMEGDYLSTWIMECEYDRKEYFPFCLNT